MTVLQRLGMTYRCVEHWYQSDLAVYQLSREDWLAAAG